MRIIYARFIKKYIVSYQGRPIAVGDTRYGALVEALRVYPYLTHY